MTDWTFYESSKWKAKCSYCGKEIPLDDGRWTAPKETGKGRFTACIACVPAPEEQKLPPKPGETPSSSNPAPSVTNPSSTYDPKNAIAKAHDDNMLSQELTRNCIAKLTESVDALTNAVNARTRILEEQIKKGG